MVVALACGCFVPRPEHYQRIPEISGVVLERGVPIEGAVVWARADFDECASDPVGEVVTRENGVFHLPGLRGFRLGVVVTGGDPGYGYSLCVRPPGQGQLRVRFGRGIGYEAPLRISPLECDLARTPITELCQG